MDKKDIASSSTSSSGAVPSAKCAACTNYNFPCLPDCPLRPHFSSDRPPENDNLFIAYNAASVANALNEARRPEDRDGVIRSLISRATSIVQERRSSLRIGFPRPLNMGAPLRPPQQQMAHHQQRPFLARLMSAPQPQQQMAHQPPRQSVEEAQRQRALQRLASRQLAEQETGQQHNVPFMEQIAAELDDIPLAQQENVAPQNPQLMGQIEAELNDIVQGPQGNVAQQQESAAGAQQKYILGQQDNVDQGKSAAEAEAEVDAFVEGALNLQAEEEEEEEEQQQQPSPPPN